MMLSPLLAEVMSGGTLILVFFLPWIFVSCTIVLYGLQVLVLPREDFQVHIVLMSLGFFAPLPERVFRSVFSRI